MSTTLSLAEVFQRIMAKQFADLFVSRPAIVKAYYNDTQTVDVTPAINETIEGDEDFEHKPLPLIQNVPVCFPRAGGFFISFPVAVGDTVMLVCADRAIDNWLESGGVVNAYDLRRHSITDAIAIPGVYSKQDALSSSSDANMVIGDDDGSLIIIQPDGTIHLGSSSGSDYVALAGKVDQGFTTLLGYINNHVHPFLATAGTDALTTLILTPPLTGPATVAATLVKAK